MEVDSRPPEQTMADGAADTVRRADDGTAPRGLQIGPLGCPPRRRDGGA